MKDIFCENNKIAVVTAIAGKKDRILERSAPFAQNTDFILFTDDVDYMMKAWRAGWQGRLLPTFSNLDRQARRNAKFPKVLPFILLPEYDYVIWHDGGHMLQVDPHRLINKYLVTKGKQVAAFKHGRSQVGHDCIYKEAENIKNIGFLDEEFRINEQVACYRNESFPEGYGLSCNAAMLWENTGDMLTLGLTWWEQICKHSSRDQMSFFYSLWKTDLKDKFTYLDGHWENNSEIKRIAGHMDPHK